jgi:hypothetical protein
MIDATDVFAPVSLTRIVADDTVNMVEWWAHNNCPTPIDGDDLARLRWERRWDAPESRYPGLRPANNDASTAVQS